MVIDYSYYFPHALIAAGEQDSVLILRKLPKPIVNGGRKVEYELEHRWLTDQCEHKNDHAWSKAANSDYRYWTREELNPLLDNFEAGRKYDIFEQFPLL